MWKYENLIPWLLDGKYALVNDVSGIGYIKKNKLINVSAGSDARMSIYKRCADVGQSPPLSDIQDLWVAVPHPDADLLAKKRKYRLKNSYADFLKRNDKFRQKELLGDVTPAWHIITGIDEVHRISSENPHGYLKRRHGSGGFTVFRAGTESDSPKFLELFKESPDDWYFEELVSGTFYSVQCLTYVDSDDVVVFGFSEQIIDSDKHYAGSKVKSLDSLPVGCYAQLRLALQRLSPVLDGYEGFFGLDFVITADGKTLVLEANIRLTAATVPTLLTNQTGGGESEFYEDRKGTPGDDAVVLTLDRVDGTYDVLMLSPKSGSLGTGISFRLADCSTIVKSLDEKDIQGIRSVVDRCAGVSTGMVVENFWPFGWTVCFVLEESHCVISSWFLEKEILVDIFSCNSNIDSAVITEAFADYFGTDSVLDVEVVHR
jgi:S-adenosylmethionine/arginine decarboxylase-like enzyme